MISSSIAILSVVAAVFLSGSVIYLITRARGLQLLASTLAESAARESALTERLVSRENSITERDALISQLQKEANLLEEREKEHTAQLATLHEKVRGFESELHLVREVEERFAQTFRSVSHEVLASNSKSFIEMASSEMEKYRELSKTDLSQSIQSVTTLVNPIQEVMGKMESKIGEIEKERSASHSTLSEQIRTLTSLNDSLRRETAQLSSALKSPNVRGQWGEVQLRRVVELAGMLEYCDFVTQESVTSEERRYRPDLIVRVPGGGSIVIDAKAPLEAYLESFNSPSEEIRAAKLMQHADMIRRHLGLLSQKSYFQQFQPSPDFVVLFIPGEAFFSAALQADPSLLQAGIERNVILATPTTLIALLKAVSYGWRQHDVEKSAIEIRNLGRDLFDRLKTFTGHLVKTRSGLEKATKSFNEAIASFETRVLVSARRFEDLGIAASGELTEVGRLSHAPRLVTVENASEDAAEREANLPDIQGLAPENVQETLQK